MRKRLRGRAPLPGPAWCWAVALLALAVLSPRMALAAAPPPFTGELEIVLTKGVFQVRKDNAPANFANLVLDLSATNGKWDRVWGMGLDFNQQDHPGRVVEAQVTADAIRVRLEMKILPDPWIAGGRARYTIHLKRNPSGGYEGSYEGAFREKPVSGAATAAIKPPRPRHAAGFTPVQPGEHPRILFRKADLPALREKMKTPLGKRFVEQARASNDATALGVLYQLTGDKQYAERALPLIEKDMADRTNGFLNLGQIWGPRLTNIALAYDLCFDALPDDFKARADDYFRWIIGRMYWRMSGVNRAANTHPCSNYHGPMRGGAAICSLAVYGDKGPAPVPPRDPGAEPRALEPARDYTPGKGVPTTALEAGKPPNGWLIAGPVSLQTKADVLAPIGGYAAARPQEGTSVEHRSKEGTQRLTFRSAPPDALIASGGVAIQKLASSLKQSLTLAYAVVKVDGPQLVKFDPGHPNARVFVAGEELMAGDFVRLSPGLYPVLVVFSIGEGWGAIAPRFDPATEAEARAELAARRAEYQEERKDWQEAQAAWEASGGVDQEKQILFEVGARQMYRSYRMMMGTGGYQTEGESYTHHGADCPLQYAVAYREMFGRDVSPYADVTLFPPRYVAATVFRDSDKPLMQAINGGGAGPSARYLAVGFPIIPDDLKAGTLWGWNQMLGVRGDATQAEDAAAAKLLQESPVYTFLHYPLDRKPEHPSRSMPLTWEAPTKGFHVFRNGYQGSDDIVAQVFLKSQPGHGWNQPNAGAINLWGLGHEWAADAGGRGGVRWQHSVVMLPEDDINVGACGHRTFYRAGKDGSGVVSVDYQDLYGGRKMDEVDRNGNKVAVKRDVYDDNCLRLPENFAPSGITGMRSVAFDYSGKCGAPALIVVVDKINGGKSKMWLWQIAEKLKSKVKIDGNTFTIDQGDATLKATFITPGSVKIAVPAKDISYPAEAGSKKGQLIRLGLNAVTATGGDDFFVVMTLQKGPAPAVKIEGRGLDARIGVGQQTVRFDGEEIVLGDGAPERVPVGAQ